MNTKQKFKDLVRQCFDADDFGWHFWLPYRDKWITGELERESNGDEYIIIYLVHKVDCCGYPIGDVIADAYITLSDQPPSDEHIANIFKYITGD